MHIHLPKISKHIMAAFVMTACTQAPAHGLDICSNLKIDCISKGNFAIVNPSVNDKAILSRITTNAEQYESYFGEFPPATIVWRDPNNIDTNALLVDAGLSVDIILPWLSQNQQKDMVRADVEKSVRKQMKGQPESLIEQILKQAYAQLDTQMEDNIEAGETEIGALQHELAHLWFIQQYNREGDIQATSHAYGGWAPDWLDETAAILHENDTLRKARWETFANNSDDYLIPLNEFLVMDHPLAEAVSEKLAQMKKEAQAETGTDEGSEMTIMVLGKDEYEKQFGDMEQEAFFYAQANAFALYLIDRSGTKDVFADITASLREGGTMGSWLGTQTLSQQLPQSMEALKTDWKKWIKAELP